MDLGAAVTVEMAATPQQVWEVVSDITRIGELSPETFEAEWLDGATGPALGARFRGHVNRNGSGLTYWTTCRVTSCAPGSSFGFDVLGPRGMVVNTWLYEIAPSAAGSSVTESFRLHDGTLTRLYWEDHRPQACADERARHGADARSREGDRLTFSSRGKPVADLWEEFAR